MDLNYLKKIIKLLDGSGVTELEIEEEGTKIRLSKHGSAAGVQAAAPVFMPMMNGGTALSSEGGGYVSETKNDDVETSAAAGNYFEVKSPMVGTFYRSPSPEADPYVKVGDEVGVGNVLCIIEAMKLMNEIESEVSGKIVKILVENAQAVEYNQPLFLIDKS